VRVHLFSELGVGTRVPKKDVPSQNHDKMSKMTKKEAKKELTAAFYAKIKRI
jgi:hypothetical protein